MVAGSEEAGDPDQELAPLARVEVADRAAEEGDQPRRAVAVDPLEVDLEVADQAADFEAGVLVDQGLRGFVGDLLGDVDRDVGAQAAGGAHRVEQVARLRGRAGAELDQGAGSAGGGEDLARAVAQDLALAAGRVVLGQLGDLLEQLRAALVVEVLRRELLGRGGQPLAHVLRHRLGGAGVEVDVDRDHPASLAQRMPAKIWRRSGRSQLRKLGRATRGWVAQELPRSTR